MEKQDNSARAPRMLYRMAATILFTALAGTPQVVRVVPLRLGSVEVSEVSPSELHIRRGGQEWKMDLSRLVRANDCVLPYIGYKRICTGPPKSPCPECPRGAATVAWDERQQRLYFAITTA
jgi:hypothetical protein